MDWYIKMLDWFGVIYLSDLFVFLYFSKTNVFFSATLSYSSPLSWLAFYLISSECIKPYRKNYGETFEHSIPENGSVLEFSPRGAPPEARPIVLWNRTNPETLNAGRGRLLRGGKVWVAERVTQADQGNYTIKDDDGNVLSRSTLSVRGERKPNMICFCCFPCFFFVCGNNHVLSLFFHPNPNILPSIHLSSILLLLCIPFQGTPSTLHVSPRSL